MYTKLVRQQKHSQFKIFHSTLTFSKMGTNLIFSLECIQYSFSSKFSNILYYTNTLGIVRYTLKFYFIANTKAKENILAN